MHKLLVSFDATGLICLWRLQIGNFEATPVQHKMVSRYMLSCPTSAVGVSMRHKNDDQLLWVALMNGGFESASITEMAWRHSVDVRQLDTLKTHQVTTKG